MRVMMRSLAAITFVLIGGCAAATTESDLPADHPANPNAAVAPAPPPSDTLALNPSTSSPTAPGGAMNGTRRDMGGMPGMPGHGGTSHTGQSAPSSGAPPVPTAGTAGALYACPMHPEVTSTNPNDRCPRCNMKTNKPVKAPAPAAATRTAPATDHAGHDAHGGGHP